MKRAIEIKEDYYENPNSKILYEIRDHLKRWVINGGIFSELQRIDIHLKIVNKHDYYMACILRNKVAIINIDTSIKNGDSDVLIGILTHELCHLVYDLRCSWFVRNIIHRIPKVLTKVEREVDQMVIDKGFGKHLLAFHKWHNKKYEAYNKKDGLTKKEIKHALKKMR